MAIPVSKQHFQDWFTQQWVILMGHKIEPAKFPWLMGPLGNVNGIGEQFINQLAEQEQLTIHRNQRDTGVLRSINDLRLSEQDLSKISAEVIKFYEKTSEYQLTFSVKWNRVFQIFGFLVNKLFSNRINQLNIPLTNNADASISSEIIHLVSADSDLLQYTFWLRKFNSTSKVIYSGIYTTCVIPSGLTCIKAIFPLPNGNATVIMHPKVGINNELILDSSGKAFGDPGFYFLLNDRKNDYWAKYVSTFEDKLIIKTDAEGITAEQKLKLWTFTVAKFKYRIQLSEVT